MASGNSSRVFQGDTQLVWWVLGEGRDVNETNESGCTALILASQDGQVEAVRLLLARKGVDVNKNAADGATARCSRRRRDTSRR
jgi:ankyrin repeat protein